MKRSVVLGAMLLVGCSYQQVRLGLRVSDLLDGNVLRADSAVHHAEVWVREATASLRPDGVTWAFSGSLTPGLTPGSFRIVGPGEGTIHASFIAGARQTLSAKVRVISPAPVPDRMAEASVPPSQAVLPTPVPAPLIAPSVMTLAPIEPAQFIKEAYRLAAAGQFFDAASRLAFIDDPDWLPKVRSLRQEWAERAFTQGLERARLQFEAGSNSLASKSLDVLETLPVKAARRQAAGALRLKLGGNP